MAGATSVLSDGSRLSRIDTALARLERAFALLSGVAVFGLMILAVVSVSGRQFLNKPLPGYVDWIELAMPFIAFLGVSYVQRHGGHIRMDIVVGALKGRALWAAELLTTLMILLLIVALVWGTWSHFLRSFDLGAPMWSRDSTIDIGLPIWPAKLVVPVAFGLLAARLVLQVYGYARALVEGAERPVAVPLVETAAEAAQREAAAMERKR